MQMRRMHLPIAVLTSLLAAALGGQVQQQGAASGRLVPANPRATAITEYLLALDAYQTWSWTDGAAHANRAFELDSTFGLARALRARYRGGPSAAAERLRAAQDAVRGSTPEAVIALANNSDAASSAALWDAAVRLLPNDPRVAVDRALSLAGRQRIDALRDVAKKFTDAPAPRMWLAYYLTPTSYELPKADGDEAILAAQEAVRLAPNSTGAHAAVGWVFEKVGRDDEALLHLGHATSMAAPTEIAFLTRAELLERQGKLAESRGSLDSAVLVTENMGNRNTYLNDRALTYLHEGNLAATLAALDDAAREARSRDQAQSESGIHATLAIVYAGAGNAKAATEQIAIERRLGATPAALADNSVIVYSLLKDGPSARRALGSYVEIAANQPPEVRGENVHRMTGLTLVAEGKGAEAIDELKQGGANPYSQLGLIEAYLQLGKKKEADAERASMFARKDFGIASTATPVAKYRAMKK
jgi:tetratricopeptide (TPR) repeat protein